MNDLNELRRDCADKRSAYHHAKWVYDQALQLGVQAVSDVTALRSELEQNLVAYYAAHSALHSAMRRAPSPAAATLN